MKKTLLLILDGVWINDKTLDENPFYCEYLPTFKKLFSWLKTQLEASWRAVWIPDWQIWNSEVWHSTIWAGQIIPQSIVKIDDLFLSWSFAEIESFKNWLKHLEENNSNLHLFTLFWNGWVHASSNHLEEILKIIPENIKVSLHLFWDWRDIAPTSMLELYKDFEKNILSKYKNGFVSSIAWRYFAMDRDNNWERVQKSYNQIVKKSLKMSPFAFKMQKFIHFMLIKLIKIFPFFKQNSSILRLLKKDFSEANISKISVLDYIENEYKNWKTDEFLTPTFFENWIEVRENDAIFFLNFRSDRAKELTKAFVEKNFSWFERKVLKNLYFATMTKYYKEYDWNFFIKDPEIKNILWEVLQNNWLRQIHLAETEKFAHVTKFFNWWLNNPFEWETDILVPSHKVATYDLDPEMSAWEIYEEFEKNIKNFDFAVINFANWDMVWHTWNMEAVKISLKKLDEILEKIINICDAENISLLITADHWNCEEMWDSLNPKTAHTTNKVPFWYIENKNILDSKSDWWLANIAPTVLKIMWIEIPEIMEESLV